MDVEELRTEIADVLQAEVDRIGWSEVSENEIDRTIYELADGHRAVIYADWQLFRCSDVQCYEEEAIELIDAGKLSVAQIISTTIALFIIAESWRWFRNFRLEVCD